MNPLAINLIRTYVPVLVGAVASFLVAHGVHVQPDQTAWAVAAMTGVFTSAYYTIVRVLEERWPWVGNVLLLSKPAATLHVVGVEQPEPKDYGEDWPPPEDGRGIYDPQPPEAMAPPRRHPAAAAPESVPSVAGLPPTATQTWPSGSADYQPPRAPLRVRKADTGAIPVYRRPPGRSNRVRLQGVGDTADALPADSTSARGALSCPGPTCACRGFGR